MTLRRLLPLLPVTLFLVLAGFFAYRLLLIDKGNTPNLLPSVMIGKPVPDFSLPSLFDGKAAVTSVDLKGKVTLVNIFASWCVPCRAEHPFLLDVKKAGITIVGIDYKDKPDEARQWIEKMGNPYDTIASDREGRVAIDFGTYGVPESYLIDKQGIIRFKQTGVLTPAEIESTLLPLAKELER